MLDNKDLELIAGVVERVVTVQLDRQLEARLTPILDKKFAEQEVRLGKMMDEKIDAKLDSLMEHQLLPQFDRIYDRLNRLDNVKADKGWVEERLDKFSIDHGLIYKSAS